MPPPRIELVGANLKAFRDTTSKELIISGPAGSGKTLANLLKIYCFVDQYPGARCLIARKTRESMTESVLVTWERDVLGPDHPALVQNPNLRRVRQAYTFPNGSTVVVGGLDKADKLLSSEWDQIYTPEVTDLLLTDWETLGSRLRANAGTWDQLFGDCNPGSPHHWVKKRCDEGKTRLYESRHHENPRYFDYRSRTWTDAGRRYLRRLTQNSGTRRKRFLEGIWTAAEGVIYQLVGKWPEEGGHLLPETWRAPVNWPRVWSIDWGKSSPTVLQMWAADPNPRADGLPAAMHLYREYFATGTRPDTLGRWAKKYLESGEEPTPRAVICDVDVQSQDNRATFEKVTGLSLQLADKADRQRGIQELQARFDITEDGRARIFFRENALAHPPDSTLENAGIPFHTVAEILEYRWNEKMLADEPQEGNDHGCDAARMAARYVDEHMSGQGVYDPGPAEPPTRKTWDGGQARKFGLR